MKLFFVAYNMAKQHKVGLFLLMGEIIISSLLLVGILGELIYLWKSADIANTFKNTRSYYFTPFTYYSPDFELNKYLDDEECAIVNIGEVRDLFLELESGEDVNALVYNEHIMANINMEMESGNWIVAEDENLIKLVAIGNEYKVGDEVVFSNDIKGYVIGTIREDSYLIRMMSSASNGNASLGAFISQAAGIDFIIQYHEQYEWIENESIRNNSSIIEIIDETKEKEIVEKVERYGDISSIDDMEINFKKNNREYFIVNGILLFVFSFLTIVGIGGTNGIWYIKNQKNYTIYYMLGLSNQKCRILEAINSFFVIGVAYSLFLILYELFFKDYLLLQASMWKTWILFILFIYYMIIYSLTSIVFIRKAGTSDIMDLYKRGNE